MSPDKTKSVRKGSDGNSAKGRSMKKLNKVAKKRMENLLAVEKLAKKALAGILKRHHKERLRLLQKQICESIKASRKADRDLSNKTAEFRFKHSKEINTAAMASPKFLPHFISQHIGNGFGDPFGGGPGGPPGGLPGDPGFDPSGGVPGLDPFDPRDNPRWDEFLATAVIMEEYLGIEFAPIDKFAAVRPLIISCPSSMDFDDEDFTITGKRFGASPGSIYITIDSTGMRIDPVVLGWSDTAISFHIPQSVSGVPFHAQGRLTVMNMGGYVSSVRVNIEPICRQHYADDQFSDHGKDWPWNDYEKEIILTSPTLPQEYQLCSGPALTADGLYLDIGTYTYVPPEGIEKPAGVELLDGPYESGNRLQAKVKVTDDWYWDYEVFARFWIRVPLGYAAQGWTKVGL
jgi:hypothetical protein